VLSVEQQQRGLLRKFEIVAATRPGWSVKKKRLIASDTRYTEAVTPMQRERIRGMARERFSELTPTQRERLGGIVRERFADLTPMQRERIREFVRERIE
jgi:hypothetical protein